MSKKNDNDIRKNVIKIFDDNVKFLILFSKIANNAFVQTNFNKNFEKKRSLLVNSNKFSFDSKSFQMQKFKRAEKLNTKSNIFNVDQKIFLIDDTKVIIYDEILHFDQIDSAIIENVNIKNCILIIIKTFKRTTNVNLKFLIELFNDNVVQWFDLFDTKSNEICMIYEQMKMSLRFINENSYIKWKTYEITTINKEINERKNHFFLIFVKLTQILNEFDHIHTKLNFYHENIKCNNILFYRFDHIKIDEQVFLNYKWFKLIVTTNIEQCAMNVKKFTKISDRENAKCFDYMMIKLMKIKTNIFRFKSIDLKIFEIWKKNTNIKNFLFVT